MKGRYKIAIASAACIAVAAAGLTMGGTLSYFTDTDEARNSFVFGTVDIIPGEPNWTPPEDPMVPHQRVPKDPTVYNNGNSDAIVFIRLDVPVEKFGIADEDGKWIGKSYTPTEVFWFELDNGDGEWSGPDNEFRDEAHGGNWIMLDKHNKAGDPGGYTSYVFGYKIPLEPASEEQHVDNTQDTAAVQALPHTEALFDYIRFKNYVEGTLPLKEYTVNCYFYAIQARWLYDDPETKSRLTESLFEADGSLKDNASLNKNTLETIYDIYCASA